LVGEFLLVKPLTGHGQQTSWLGAMNIDALKNQARRASSLLKAMGNERRMLILCFLAEGEKSVSELEKLVGLSQSALSQHLARLRRDKLVRTRRSAQTIYYSLNGRDATSVMRTLHDLFCAEDMPRRNGKCAPCAPEPMMG